MKKGAWQSRRRFPRTHETLIYGQMKVGGSPSSGAVVSGAQLFRATARALQGCHRLAFALTFNFQSRPQIQAGVLVTTHQLLLLTNESVVGRKPRGLLSTPSRLGPSIVMTYSAHKMALTCPEIITLETMGYI